MEAKFQIFSRPDHYFGLFLAINGLCASLSADPIHYYWENMIVSSLTEFSFGEVGKVDSGTVDLKQELEQTKG